MRRDALEGGRSTTREVHASRARRAAARLQGLAWLAVLTGCAACGVFSTPRARVNQLGYLPSRSKVAIVNSPSRAPLPFEVVDESGSVAWQGETRLHGEDRESGDHVHVADFTALRREGSGYRVIVEGEASYAFDIDRQVYRPLRSWALAFFYHNRSGVAVEVPYAGQWKWTHGPGHLSDSSVGCLADACSYRLDVLGGWYDAGDHGKYVVNGGIAVWTLNNLYERARHFAGDATSVGDGAQNIPEGSNGFPDVLDEARWEMEFLLRMQVPRGQEKAGMAHHKVHDTSWSELGRVPPEIWKERYLHAPSTAATLNLAATAAQSHRLWKDLDPAFAEHCRLAAIRAWNAAQRFPSVYAPQHDNQGGGPYDDTDVSDEFYWAAAELYLSLGSQPLLTFLRKSQHHGVFAHETEHEHVMHHTSMTWQSTAALGAISLATATEANVRGQLSAPEKEHLRNAIVSAADAFLSLASGQGYRVPMSAGSNGHYPWGSNSLVANNAIVLALAHDFTSEPRYLDGVVDGMDYLLGRNPLNRSYVSGFGERAFENPHHRFWAHQKRSAYPHPPPGALAGGPNSRLQDPTSRRLRGCPPQRCYVDHVDAWSVNEVAINWNAPLSWLAAFLDERGQGS